MKRDRIVVLSGPLQGQEFEIDGALQIGRNPDSNLFLDDLQVSVVTRLLSVVLPECL